MTMEFNNIYSGLISGKEKLALVGLGYVGMPIAVEFAKHIKVIGYDINENRVNEYINRCHKRGWRRYKRYDSGIYS